eukprot:2498370-Rhodomonas_salina.2
MKYESIAKNINSGFMQEYFKTTALGLRHIKLQLETAAKHFTTVKAFCEHMQTKPQGMERAEAWKLAQEDRKLDLVSIDEEKVKVLDRKLLVASDK